MADDTAISSLPAASALDGTEVYAVVQGGATKRTTLGTIASQDADDVDINGKISSSTIVTEFSGDVTEWDSGSSYDEGDLVRRAGIVFAATGSVSSDPLNPANYADWYPSRAIRDLIHHALTAEPIDRELHPIHDVNAGTYVQHLLVNRATLDGTEYEFDLVHLDGAQITGDSDLEAIFDPDGSDEYPFLSLIAEEDAGTWTLKDHAGTFAGAQTSGGERDTLGEVGADQMQRITGYVDADKTGANGVGTDGGALSISSGNERSAAAASADSTRYDFDSADSPDARASSSTDGETRPAYATTGIPAIIVMREASS